MKMNEIAAMSNSDIRGLLAVSGENLFRVRFQKSLGDLGGLKQMQSLKRDIARMKTALRSRATQLETSSASVSTNGRSLEGGN